MCHCSKAWSDPTLYQRELVAKWCVCVCVCVFKVNDRSPRQSEGALLINPANIVKKLGNVKNFFTLEES